MALCEADLRCLDAHAHLGNLVFVHMPKDAIRHYEAGLRIGELSLGDEFEGVLPWGHVDNRPFLRCMHGFGLSCWRLGRPHLDVVYPQWPFIMMLYGQYADKKPMMLFDFQEQRVYAFSYKAYRAE